MIDSVLERLSIVHYFLLTTFLFALYGLRWKNPIHRCVLVILAVFVMNESVTIISQLYDTTFKISVTITTYIHHSMWLLILRKAVTFPKVVTGFMIAFITFCLCDLFLIEGWLIFNCYSFIVGAFMYLILFLIESFYQLRKENFPFFFSNQFILLMAPVLFFIGLTFMFGFKSRAIMTTVFFEKFQLYRTIIIVVNMVYYSLLNIYIYREKKILYEF